MKTNIATRRDFLKLLGAVGVSTPVAALIQKLGLRRSLSDDPGKPNIIVLLFDTLSARHMGLYGYHRRTTPYISDFAAKSTVFHRHYAAASHTRPSTGSFLTGVYPWSHRTLNYYAAPLDFYNQANIFAGLSKHYYREAYTHNVFAKTILNQFSSQIDLLKSTGDLVLYNPNSLPAMFRNDSHVGYYATKRWRDNYMGTSNSLFIDPITTLLEIYSSVKIQAEFADSYPIGLSDNQEGNLFRLEDAMDYIGRQATVAPAPFFAYFHLLPPHENYRPRADFLYRYSNDHLNLVEKPPHAFTQGVSQAELEQSSQRYDEYIGLVDSEFGRLYQALEANNALANTYLILTSDHGQLFERGIHGHGTRTLYESLIHIPLIIHSPGQAAGQDIRTTTSNIDVLPTILQLAHEAVPDWCEGKPLPSFGGAHDPGRVIFSMDGKENARTKPLTKATFSAIHWPYKLIHYRGYPGFENFDELYDLEADPEELDDLIAAKPATAAALKQELIRNQIAAEEKSIGESISGVFD